MLLSTIQPCWYTARVNASPGDPVYRHARREATLILLLWLCCFVYTVPFCYLNGYLIHDPAPHSFGPSIDLLPGSLEAWNRDPGSLNTPLALGIPDWIFYGVFLPWAFCILFTFWFCLFRFQEDDLGEVVEGENR